MTGQPKSHWQRRYEKGQVRGDVGPGAAGGVRRPKGAITATPSSSLTIAVASTVFSVLTAVMTILEPDWSRLFNFWWLLVAVLSWRSYIILRRAEAAQPEQPPGTPPPDPAA